MGQGASVLVPPSGQWFSVIKQWRKRDDFGGVLFVDQAPFLLKAIMWMMQVPTLLLRTDELKGLPDTVEIENDQAALISYSSGSTGEAKILRRSHRVLGAQHRCLKRCFPPVPCQIDSSVFANVLLHQLATGTCSQLPANLSKGLKSLDYIRLSEEWRTGGVTTITGNPYVFNRILALDIPPFLKVNACGIGGAPVDEGLLSKMQKCFPNATIYVIYGATEVEPIALRPYVKGEDPSWGYAVGTPVDCLDGIEIRNPQPIRMGQRWVQAGEITVCGPHVLTTQHAWHATGDFGFIEDGQVFLTARSGNTEPCEGYQHYQIEHVLRLQEGIAQVAVHTKAEVLEVAYCGSIDTTKVRQYVEQYFPAIARINVYKKKRIPLDTRHHSKILYNQIRYGN